ncbi:hypothetical protein Agub_g10612, partial [Astrephomene gubernaculifera]
MQAAYSSRAFSASHARSSGWAWASAVVPSTDRTMCIRDRTSRSGLVLTCALGKAADGNGASRRKPAGATNAAPASGPDSNPGEPLVLKKSGQEEQQPSAAPLKRTAYRRPRQSAEERRQQREQRKAELAALRRQEANREFLARPAGPSSSSSAAAAAAAAGLKVALVDGYNLIWADKELTCTAQYTLEGARDALNRMADAFGAANGVRVYVVYDAMGNSRAVQQRVYGGSAGAVQQRVGAHAVQVFSMGSEADSYLGKAAGYWKRRGADKVMVVSNDRYVRDLALDADFTVFPLDPATWLQQAHAALAGRGRSG